MNFHMVVQATRVRKHFGALGTAKGLLLIVNSQMSVQASDCTEGLVALCTVIELFPCMRDQVLT